MLLSGSMAFFRAHDRQGLALGDALDTSRWAVDTLIATTVSGSASTTRHALDVQEGITMTRFDPPGPGMWMRLGDHFPGALTPEYQLIYAATAGPGMADYMGRYGAY